MTELLFAAAYAGAGNGVVTGAVLMAVLCAIGIAIIAFSVVRYVKSGRADTDEDKALEDGAETGDIEPAQQPDLQEDDSLSDEAPDVADEPLKASEQAEITENDGDTLFGNEAFTADAPEEASEAEAEEVIAEYIDKSDAECVDEAVAEPETDSTDDERGEITALAVSEAAVTLDEKEIPEFIDKILADLSPESAALFARYIVERDFGFFSTMKDVRDYESESEFLTDFFKNSIRFKKVFNAEIYTLLYNKYKRGKNGEELSKLRMKYVNALYYYRKDDPSLVSKCIVLLKDDIDYKFNVVDVHKVRVPSVKKLISIYSSRKDYKEALDYCDKAIERGLYDVRSSGFEARRERLETKVERENARRLKQAEKTQK
ncbi:MAG: hypothetical protein ACLTEK_02485 [Christensenellales bacterium]